LFDAWLSLKSAGALRIFSALLTFVASMTAAKVVRMAWGLWFSTAGADNHNSGGTGLLTEWFS